MSDFVLNRPINFSLILFVLPVLSILGNWVYSSIFITIFFVFLLFDYLNQKEQKILLPFFPMWVLLLLWNIYVGLKTHGFRIAFDYYTGTVLIPFFIFFIIVNVKFDKDKLTKLFDLFLFSGVVLGAYSIMLFVGSGFNLKLRIPSLWENFNIVSAYFMILFLLNLTFLINRNTFQKKIIYTISLVIILFGMFLTQTRGVWLATVLAIVFFFFKKPKVIVPAVFVLGTLVLLFFNVINDRLLSVKNFGNDVSSLGRLQAWLSSIILIKNNFLIGYGFDSYLSLRDSVFGFYFVELPHSHNTYLRMILESGFIGFAIYFSFMIAAFVFTFSLSRKPEFAEYKPFIDGFQLILFALFIAFNFEPYFSLYGVSTIVIWVIISFVFKFRFDKTLINKTG